jgi:lipid A oxidase
LRQQSIHGVIRESAGASAPSALLGLAAGCRWASTARAEVQIGAYTGWIHTHSSDVGYSRPNGTNVTFESVDWDGKPFSMPPYWGVFANYWFSPGPSFGIQIDYAHAKMYSRFSSGTPVVGGTFSKLEFTDGLNLLTANALYRWPVNAWIQPFVGVGVGFAFPHVEVETAGFPRTFEYQVTGVAAAALAGIDFKITDNVSLLTEYKFTYADIDADLRGGGSLKTEAFTHQFMIGASYSFGGSPVASPVAAPAVRITK